MAAAAHNPTSSKDLKDQAAAAALYVTEPQRQVKDARREANWPLDANGKLTSAGAATSLKRADAKDLPSFPSVGIASSAAGGAAMLANQNQKSFEWWKPEASAGASKAAMLAKDYKMDPLWQPEASSAGSKAALLAHQRGHGAQFWEPTASDKALIAATGAVAGKTGRPAKTTELGVDRYPDEKNAARNALSAATLVHGNSTRSRNNDLPGLSDEEAEKIRKQATVAGMNAELFGSKPLIGPELEEQKHQASLHAAAVTMAQGMYGKRDKAYREKMDAARAGSRAASGRQIEDDSDEENTPMSFMGLQETAQKLANERLAKLNDPNDAYKQHWGTHSPPPKNRLSFFGGSRRKSMSEDGLDEDQKDSRRIRGEMNLFKDKLKEIDDRKRKDDRQSLLAAAQRNVKKDIADMDEYVFQQTGKMSPAMRAEWEAKARAKAQADSENRKSNYGKVDVGGGKYLDQTEIDAIAEARLRPTLDAITAKAEHDREIDEQAREEEEERKRIERLNKEEEKEQNRQQKAEWKHFKAEEKAAEQERKAKEKEERRKSKQAAEDAKMQEKFEETIHKEEEEAIKQQEKDIEQDDKEVEKEAKAVEKEHDKQIKAEWKLFKRQEKKAEEDEKAAKKRKAEAEKERERQRKEAETEQKKENRLSSIFRRKSKKEKPEESDKKEDKPIPGAGTGTTTTIITGGAAADAAEAQNDWAHASSASQSVPHHEEPHHNPLMPVEETPEARAANQQKPGGDLIQIFRRKKQEHDEKKRKSIDAGHSPTNGSALVGKDEPAKPQPSTGEPVPEAIAPENAKEEQHHTHVAPAVAVGAAGGVAIGAAVAQTEEKEYAEKPAPLPEESGQPHRMLALFSQTDEPATQARQEPPVPASDAVVKAPADEAAPVPETPAEEDEPPTPAFVDASASPFKQELTPMAEDDSEPIMAIGSDKPVTHEVRRSSILDKIEPRVNVGKPSFEGSEKFAAMTADMRGTDHAGADKGETHADSGSAKDATAAPPSVSDPAYIGHDPSAHQGQSIIESTEGNKQGIPVEDRVGVPQGATQAAEQAVGEKGSHGTPRAKESKEKSSHRISGFFRSKFGTAGKKLTKEHRASDGVKVSPTTENTTHGKYVDPEDKHSSTVEAAVPANKELLDRESEAKGIQVDPSHAANEEEPAVSPLSEDEDPVGAGTSGASKIAFRGRSDLSEEARDTVDNSTLPLPKIPAIGRSSESPARETRFKEQI